jgi:lipopolysaccharide biosynthesis protein
MKRRLTERLRAAWDAFRREPEPGVWVHLTFWDQTPVIVCDPAMTQERFDFVCAWMVAAKSEVGASKGGTWH